MLRDPGYEWLWLNNGNNCYIVVTLMVKIWLYNNISWLITVVKNGQCHGYGGQNIGTQL